MVVYVTRSAKINHVSANYTELYFCKYLLFRTKYPAFVSCRKITLNSAVLVMKILLW